MNFSLLPWTEAERLRALYSYDILDTPQEKDFDDVVRMVCELLDVPIAAVNLIDQDRQWFKAEIGLGLRQMPLDDSICRFALLAEGQMVVPDTRDDERFACNPLVTGEHGLRFYAGQQLLTPEGLPLGTLCALGHEARPQGLSERQAFVLQTLARQVMSQLELRRVLRMQQALLAEQARVQQALLEADQKKDEFLAMLAHELRNPLAPITSAADILALGPDATRVRQASAIITRQARHMTGLIDDLLDVSRVNQGKITLAHDTLDLKDIVADAVEQVRPLVERHRHSLALRLAPLPAFTIGDRKRLVQVFTNLLSNAAKYTPDGGHIELALDVDGEAIEMSVRDDGIGMTPALLENAFELFSQDKRSLDRSQGGLGIGLALVRRLLTLHGGSIRAESEGPDRGSRFIVRLPRTLPAQGALPEPEAAPAAAAAQGLRIAIVDDNEDAAAMLAMFLENVGHTVLTLHSSSAALQAVPAYAPDVCLLDIGLPDIDGYALARSLRASAALQRAALLAVTGYGQDRDRQAASEAGFDDLLVKPVDLGVLQRWLGEAAASRPGVTPACS